VTRGLSQRNRLRKNELNSVVSEKSDMTAFVNTVMNIQVAYNQTDVGSVLGA
jgi:hypothetical protein